MSEPTADTTTMIPNLMDCDALMLSSFLLHHRFQGDAMATASFLLEATSTLPNAEEISAQLMGDKEQEDGKEEKKDGLAVISSVESTDLGSALTSECTVSMTTPRGKFRMSLYEQGIHCISAKNQVLVISPQAVEQMVLFPKPEDCRTTSKKRAGPMVLLCLRNETSTIFNDKSLTQVCLQLPNEPPIGDDSDETTWLKLLCSSLSLHPKKQVAIVVNPKSKYTSRYSFKSHDEGTTSSTTAGMPFVQCYHGVNDGVLYPMQEGLLFFKPPMFLHRSTLKSIACGRGSGGSRYVDLSLTLDDDSPLEFTNIHREELAHLNDYIHTVLIPAMKADAMDKKDNSDDHSATVQDAAEEVMSTSLGKRKRTQRKASEEARQATKAHMERIQDQDSDEDDDEGWVEGQGGEDLDSEDDDDFDDGGGEPDEAMAENEEEEDDEEEEDFSEEENSGTATESEED